MTLYHMLESSLFFTTLVDRLVDMSEHDPELADGIRWLDEQARKRQISFYEMIFDVLYKHDMNTRVEEWMNSRN